MSNLLAELQAKQKLRAASVSVSPAQAAAINASAASSPGPTPTPHHGIVGASGHPVPPPRVVPPPPPPKSQSVILPGPPLAASAAGADGSSAGGERPAPPLPRGIPAGAVPLMPIPSEHATRPLPPPIPSRTGPPPLPPGSSRPAPPPLPQSHHPSPPPPPPAASSSSSSASDAQTPTAPDTPAGSRHRTSGSFSSTLAPPSFSPAASPHSPSPPSMPLPPMPHVMGASPVAPNRPAIPPPPPKRVVVPDANRTLYLNDYPADGGDDESADAAEQPEFRLDMSGSAIKLNKTVKVYSEKQENRFLDDFVPTIPPGADSLVASSLTAFNRPIKAFLRTHVKYHKIVNPNAAPAGTVLSPKAAAAKDTALVEFECDEPFRASAAEKDAAGSGAASSGKKKKDGLADLFNQPGVTSPPPAAPPAAERSASEGSVTLAQQQADEAARQAEIDSLVNLSLLHMTPALASAAVHADDAVFARKEENLFLRSHPSFEYNELQHKAEFTICKRMPTSAATAMWSRDPGTQFLTSVHALRIGIGNVEPFFGTLALYDLKAGVRLTEDFHFDLNDNSLLTGQLEVNKSCADPITLCGHALFSCQDKHDSVFMVVKLERILQGDPAELEYYFKPKQRTPAEMAALVKKTRNNLIYLSDYRQPFGWGMIPMFEETGELKNWATMPGGSGPHERGPNYVRFDKIFAQMDSLKDDLFIQLLRETRESASKGGKVYPGTYFDLRIEEMNENELPVNRVDVSCIALKNTEGTKVVEEIAEYNVAADTPLPTGPGNASARPSISVVPMVPSTPMAGATPQTPSGGSGAGAPATPSSGHPGHQSQPSMTGIALQLPGGGASATSSADKALLAPPHSTPYSNNPIPSPPLIREIEEFTDYSPPLGALANNGGMVPPTPHTFFVNMMYIYPEFIKFEKFRNIACRVQLRTNDQNPVGEGMKVIRGRSSGSNFTTSALTQVNYHRKQLTPQEEVACVLPLSLNASTHLFFTFYKVSCKTDPGKREVIGMACLPLSQKGRVLVDDVYQLPIAAKLPKNYLQPYADGKETDELHFRHSGAKCFSVRLKLVSSIFSQDEPIYSFLQQFPNAKELIASGATHGRDLLHKAVEHIHRINPWYTVKFLPPLLDYMFELIQNRATPTLPGNNANQIQASYYAFLGLTYLVYRISEYYVHEGVHGHSGNRCSILVAYITHRLENLQTPSVMMQAGTAAIPNALGVEAGPASAATGATPTSSVTYTPLYAVFAKLWLVGLNPSATSDNAALFTLPSTAAASSSSSASAAASLSSPQMGGTSSASGSAMNPSSSPSSATSGLTSPPASSPTNANSHQTLHERLLISYAWFYFEVIYKSLVLERERQMTTKGRFEDDDHLAEFLKHFESLLGTIVSILTKHRTVGLTSVKHLIHNLALFFNDLYSVLEKDRVVGLLQNFLLSFRRHMDYNDPVLVEMLFTFYHIILDFEWGVDVMEVETIQPSAAVKGGAAAASAASAAAAAEGKEAPDLLDRIKAKYPLISLFIVDYITHLSSMRESLIRENIINSLRMFLTKHDWDQRWQSNKKDLATMFLPLLPGLMEELDMLRTQAEKDAANAAGESSSTSASSEKATTAANTPLSPTGASVAAGPSAEESKLRRNILICVLWILKNVPLELLREWWNHDLLECAGARAAGTAAGGGEDGEPAPHSEAPHLEFMSLLDYCITSFPYAGIHKRETDTEYDSILSPESIAAFMGEGAGLSSAGGGVNDLKSDIEALMSNIHKTRTLGGGGTLRSARGSTINNERNATLGPGGLTGGGGGKSTLRQLRAQLANSGMGLAPGMGDSIAGQGTIGRSAGVSFSSTTLPGSGNTIGASGTYRAKTFGNTATLTQSSREHLIKLVKWEGYLTRAVSSIVVRLLSEYLEDFHVFITEKRNWLEDESTVEANCFESFNSVIRVFTSLVGSNQSTGTLLQLFPTMLLFLQRYGAWFHLNPTIKRAIGHFTSTAFRVCAFASREVRCHAVALMYSLLSINYALDGNVYNLQMQLTISLSKLTENLSMASEKYLQCSIQALMRTAAQALAKGTGVAAAGAGAVPQESLADFKTKVDTLLQRLSTILSDSMEIARQAKLPDSDTATSESLLVQIADAFSHIPEIRIEWLNRLAQHHQRHEQFAEAGQCYIQMASLVLQPAAKSSEGGFAVEKTSAELDRLIMNYYEHACKMLDKAELYEQASDVYKLLQPIYHKYRDYKSLSLSHQHLHQMFEKLIEALKKQSRMLGTYYRIGFYGLKFGERLHGQEFIYKLPKITRIMEVTSRMKSLYSAQLGVPVRVLPDSNPVDMSKLDMEECVMQITFVNPYFPVDTGAAPSDFERSIDLRFTPRTHWIEQNTGLQAFKFSTPFTTGGKTFGSTAEQHKRNTVLYVRAEFPYILTAQSVVKRQETILSPILSATEDVNLRTNSLLELLSSETLNAKVLTGLLAGSVATQVHGGSKEICQAFLTPQPADDAAAADAHSPTAGVTPADLASAAAAAASSSEPHPTSIWSDADQSKLKVAMRKFLDACVLGLEANKKLAVTESEKEFQLNLETQFVDLTGFIHPLIRETKIKKKGVKKGVRFG